MREQKADTSRPTTASDWMAELGQGELDPAQKSELADWLRESPRNVREFLEATLLGQDLRDTAVSREQLDDWVKEVRESRPAIPFTATSKASLADETPVTGREQSRSRLRTWGIAASVALVATISAATYLHWQDGRYSTDLGEQRILTLADGSVVTLNTSSTIKVDFSGQRRNIELIEGEAFFRVAHDTSRPFDVNARDTTARAVGTQFNVRIAGKTTLVSVLDGIVDVRERDLNKPAAEPVLRLLKGEEATVDASRTTGGQQAPRVVKTAHAAPLRAVAWTRGRVEFDSTPLVDVLSEFQRYREFKVSVAEPLQPIKLTGSFDAQDLESALAYIGTLPGVVVETTGAQSFLIRER
ncbi:FecR family protein [Steroidobacter sp.]|uniref:FecR family protein n=1 Tax=Steroidobacter sp. TaxID=1978227 RepID=UPI001A432BAD|nr:FecR domain-containing protein [Steroidobacter sp.]MBL8265655.1 FecR domain-containing protein [Steroidobacter sp.]